MDAVDTGVGVVVTRGRIIQVIAHAFCDLGILPMHRDLVPTIADNVIKAIHDLAVVAQAKQFPKRSAEVIMERTYRRPHEMSPGEYEEFKANLRNPCREIVLPEVGVTHHHQMEPIVFDINLDEKSMIQTLMNKAKVVAMLAEQEVKPDHVVE